MIQQTEADILEINLTPLLDLVLQLIMFFMACVNFVSEALNLNVVLPGSLSAQEIQVSREEEQLIVNIELLRREKLDATGNPVYNPLTHRPEKELIVPRTTRIVFANLAEVSFRAGKEDQGLYDTQKYIRDLAANLKAVLRVREKIPEHVPAGQIMIPIPVIIRGDVETTHGLVLKLMAQFKAEGFSEVRLRALQRQAGEGK
jgi:biopolymer transport protein ExbD